MITINIGITEYQFPTNWEEVEIGKILECSTPKGLIQSLGGVPVDVLERLSEDQVFLLYDIVSFIDNEESISDVVENIPCLEIENEPWEKLEESRQSISNKLYNTLFHLCKIYYPGEKKTVHQLSLGYQILNQINVFLSHYQEMFDDKPDPLEEEAGSEELSSFGSFATCYTLAGEDILKMEPIYKLPAIQVYNTLFLAWKKNRFQKKLMELRAAKQKT